MQPRITKNGKGSRFEQPPGLDGVDLLAVQEDGEADEVAVLADDPCGKGGGALGVAQREGESVGSATRQRKGEPQGFMSTPAPDQNTLSIRPVMLFGPYQPNSC